MKNILFILLCCCFACKQESKQKPVSVETVSEHVEAKITETIDFPIYNFDELEPLLHTDTDKVYVVNFWATWCAPCVKELPYFEKIGAAYADKNVELILVSLDFPNQYETKLKPFIAEKELKSKVVALNDTDSNTWIPKVDDAWSGSIPATLIFNKDERKFYEQTFTYEALETEIKSFLN